jgi:hypothetical protein
MAWHISWHLTCDKCRKKATFSGQPSTAVEKKAMRYGWKFVTDEWGLIRHHCPACAKELTEKGTHECPV